MSGQSAKVALIGAACIVALPLAANGTSPGARELPLRLDPREIAHLEDHGPGAGTSGVAGIRSLILSGDPANPGPYTIEVIVPPYTRIAPHSHRDDRSAVVVSGVWYLGYGTQADDVGLKRLLPGSFYTEPAGLAHFAMTGSRRAIVYISGFGPSSTDYVATKAAPTPHKKTARQALLRGDSVRTHN